MNKLPTLTALLTASGIAHAANLPAFEVTCPTDLSVRAEAGGPVYVNDKPLVLHKQILMVNSASLLKPERF